MAQTNMDLGVFFETNFMDIVYMRYSSGCQVTVTEAPRKHQGRFTVLYHNLTHCNLESIKTFVPYIIIFQMLIGQKHWNVVM